MTEANKLKQYKKMDVLKATEQRLTYIFTEFNHVYFSLSGGKDSGLMVQIANRVAKKMGKKFDLFILDIEANYTSTVEFIERMKRLSNVENVYHFCLPFFEDNNVSIFQPQWMMWNPQEEEKWIQAMPKDAIKESDIDGELRDIFYKSNGNPDRFMRYFIYWYHQQKNFEPVACGIGIRAEESIHRLSSILSKRNKYHKISWIKRFFDDTYNFYPIYDWKVEDVWGAVAQLDLDFNQFYEQSYKMGIAFQHMRICQPYGLQQRKSLSQFAVIEPELWQKVVNRVSGADFGRFYSKTSLLGHHQSSKPKHLTWQEYAIYLLETIGLTSTGLRDHYYRKIKILMDYYQKNYGITPDDMPDESTRKEWLADEKLWHDWKGIARALEKNDYALTTRDYALTKEDEKELYKLYFQFQEVTGIDELEGKVYQKIKQKLLRSESD